MSKNILFFYMILFLFYPCSATAGGTDWSFQVKELREGKNGEHFIVLKPLESGKDFPLTCDVLAIQVQYASWRNLFVLDKNISKENHKKALSLLKDAFAAKKSIRVGSMGEGFGFNGKNSCSVSSKALSVIDIDGEKVIYSYFKWP